MKEIRDRISAEGTRVRVIALFCVTVIAIVAMLNIPDPENLLVNIVVAIGSFLGGSEAERRKMDSIPPNAGYTQTLTESTTASKPAEK